MNPKLYEKFHLLSDSISVSKYIAITGQKIILPFYHTVVQDPKPHLKHLGYYRNTENFISDLDFFQENFQSIAIHQLQKKASVPSFHITFDDGLSEIYEDIIPLLLERKIDATFFINSDFVDNKRLFYRHKISIIIDEISTSENAKTIASEFLNEDTTKIFDKINLLTDEQKIDDLARILKIDFKNYLQENKPYLTLQQLVEIKKMGFTLGNHSKSHPNFNSINFQQQQLQVAENNLFLLDNFGVQDYYFSFPFGDQHIKNDFFDWMYQSSNIQLSFGVSGLKKDAYTKHLHRIPMEFEDYSANQIIKFQYFYYLLKFFLGKNKIRR